MCDSMLPHTTVTAQYGDAGTANSQRRSNLRAVGRHRKRTRDSHLITCTYNCRSISTAAQLSALVEEAKRTSYHVIGLSERRREDPLSCTWQDGTAVFLGARKAGIIGGVGFIVAPQFAKYVSGVTFHNHRLGVLTATLTKDISVSIIQVYAPTADSSEELHEDFFEELGDLIRSQKSSYIVVSGDYARVGPRRTGEQFIEPNSAESRNEAGEILANFCETQHLYHGNSHIVKKPESRWTYPSPNGQYHHELDHILCSRRALTDVGVVPSFNTGSNSRLLRARLHFDRGQVRIALIQSRQSSATVINTEAIRTRIDNVDLSMGNDIGEDYARLTNIISKIVSQCRSMAPNHDSRRISDATRSLLAQRRLMDRQRNHVEYTILSKLCKRKLAEDHRSFSQSRLLDAAKNRCSLKKTRLELAEYRHVVACLKAPNGTRSSSRPEMESIVTHFYSNLFKTNVGTNPTCW